MALTSFHNPIDLAFRTIESIAFSIHAILGLTEPFTGCLRRTFQDKNAMPSWFWPVAGAILLLIAYLNFSSNDNVILAVQVYIASFHTGAIFYHQKLGHHPAAGVAPGVFVVFAFIVGVIRTNVIVALIGLIVSVLIAYGLSEVLVRPKLNQQGEFDENEERNHQGYSAIIEDD